MLYVITISVLYEPFNEKKDFIDFDEILQEKQNIINSLC